MENLEKYDQYIRAAEMQMKNEDNNPTLLLTLSELHSGITAYKKAWEKLKAELEQAEADMKEVLLGEDICNFCKNKISDEVCESHDCNCAECMAECSCKLCSFDSESTCNFKWRGRV